MMDEGNKIDFSVQFANDGLAGELLPPRLGLTVRHHQVAVAQVSRCAKVVDHAVQPAVEGDGRIT